MKHLRVSVQHPQANGQCERLNKEVTRLLGSLCEKADHSDWARHVSKAQLYLNRVVSRSTAKAPFEALHGYLPRMNLQARDVEKVQENTWVPAAEIQDLIREKFSVFD